MMSFKFEYVIKPSANYKIGYGLKSKPRPYPFNFPVGLKNGNYRFNYDRRDQIHIEGDGQSFVSWGKDMDLEKDINPLIKKIYEMETLKEKELEKLIKKEVLKENSNSKLESLGKELYKDVSIELKKNKIKNLYIERSLELEKIKLKYLDMYEEFLFAKKKIKELIKGNPEYLLNHHFIREISVGECLNGLDQSIEDIVVDNHRFMLETIKKALEKEIESLLNKNDRFDMCYKTTERSFSLNLFKQLEESKTTELTSDFIKTLDIEKMEIALTKEDRAEIVVKSIVLLTKLSNEININKELNPLFKVLNEIYRYKELLNKVLFLYTLYDLEKEDGLVEVETSSAGIDKSIEKSLDKNFEVDLAADSNVKMLISNAKHNMQVELKEKLLKDTTISEVDIEECFKQLEGVYEIVINIERRMKQLDKESITDLSKEKDIHLLIKKLIIHDLVTENELLEFEKSPIGKMILEEFMTLDREQKEMEIVVDKSIPMIRSYKEIMINNDIQTIKKAIEIDLNKEIEFKKVISDIEMEKNDTKIKFNKRFWFLRATDPFDWKILPYSDYPYRDKPVIFNQDKKIPDNWQLEMIPDLYKEINKHPMPFGEDLGDEEMALSIEIMIDVINIMILIWSRMFYNFSGYTGSQAVIRFTKLLYNWLMLETSIEEMEKKRSKEHYFRVYRWIRWEAEKVAIKARDDMTLSGNMYIDEWIFELIYYMENHHFDTMPIFNIIQKMDEFRALLPSDDPQGDINFVLDKVKGMRHKIIECKANKSNE
ncbi:MAG: hypothetical protein TIS_03752 [Tissierella sp.]